MDVVLVCYILMIGFLLMCYMLVLDFILFDVKEIF